MVRVVDGGHEDVNETTSLLSPQTEPNHGSKQTSSSFRTRCTRPWIHVVIQCVVIAVIADIGEYLFLAPKVRLFESSLCTDYYLRENPLLVDRNGNVPEHFCKVDSVQDKLAMILGWQVFFDGIPAILLPVPYGYLADRYGRKWVTVLSLLGGVLSCAWMLFVVGTLRLPLQYVWLSSLFLIVGGGGPVASTMITTIVADVTPPEKRSSAFFYRFTSDLIAECFIPPITSILMSKALWTPLLMAMAFNVACFALTLTLPETLPFELPESEIGEPRQTRTVARVSHPREEPDACKMSENGGKWKNWTQQAKESFAFTTRDATVTALVFTFLVSKIGRQSTNLLLQYVSKRYDWSLAQAGLLSSLRAGVNVLLFTVALPAIAAFALARTSPTSKDVWIARTSIVLMILGTVVLSVSATPALMITGLIIYTLGTGYSPVVRSLTTSLVESNRVSKTSDVGRLYALISVMEGLGSLLAGPGMAWMFRFGISLGKSWLGMPFALAAVLFALVSPVLFMIKA